MGKQYRLKSILGDGNGIVVVALDHPRTLFVPELTDPTDLIRRCRLRGVRGFLVTAAAAARFEPHFAPVPVIVSLAGEPSQAQRLVDWAVRFGASSIKVEVFPEGGLERASYTYLEDVAVAASDSGLPVMGEVIPHGFRSPEAWTMEALRRGARMAAEAGADYLKLPLPSDGGTSEVTEYASVPVLFLGGCVSGTFAEFVERSRLAKAEGAAGMVVGRYLFEDIRNLESNLDDLTAALR